MSDLTGGMWDTTANTDPAVGPQTDGTNLISGIGVMAQPADTAGGQPANYSPAILDIFKYGVGQYAQTVQQQQLLDYKSYQATNGGLYQAGKSAVLPKAAQGGGMTGQTMMIVAAIILFAVLTHHHV